MMVRFLSLLLVAQLVLVVGLYLPSDSPQLERRALVTDVTLDAVTQIDISDGENSQLVLRRDDEGWRMASGLPADAGKVAALLRQFLDTDPGFAIAQSAASAKRFGVSPAVFERRIVLRDAQGDASIYLGTSPSLGKVHARRDGEDAVFVLKFSHYDAPAETDGWLDTRLLAPEQLSHIGLYGVEFTRGEDSWSRSDGEPLDQAAVETLVNALKGLRVTGVTNVDDLNAANAGEALRLTLGNGTDNERAQLSILDEPESERYYLRSDHYSETFDTSAYDAERLIAAARTLMDTAHTDSADDGDVAKETP